MKRLLALVLCLCFALGGCAGAETTPDTGNNAPAPAANEQPAAPEGAKAADFERLALELAALPGIPAEPDETALREKMNGKSPEEQNRLWDEFSAQLSAHRDAIQALRGDGVDAAFTPAFAAYTLRTARELMGDETEKNVVYSPVNLYLALCMLAETTDGESRAQLLGLLGLSDVDQARAAAGSLWRSLYNDSADGRTLLANSLWLNERLDFHGDTVAALADDYYASTFRAPMGDRATDAAIAAWINENTNHLLENAAGGMKTDPDTLLLLISALYFKGTWADQFEEYATSEDVFTAADSTEQRIDFMHKTERGVCYRGEHFTAASLPFRDGTAMWFLLPDEGYSVQEALPDVDNLLLAVCGEEGAVQDTAFGPLIARESLAEIVWSVPKFDVDSDLSLISALKALGVTDVFTDAADFSPLTDLDAAVSAIEHAARVKVDEEGCEAAAFTAITVGVTSALVDPLPRVEMDLDRPFGFLITGAEGLPLFLSVVNTMK